MKLPSPLSVFPTARKIVGTFTLSLALGACSVAAPISDPLIGKIWQVADQRFVSIDAVVQKARTADIVLLGETHDNAAHHVEQNRLLTALADVNPPPVLVMEQFDLEQQASLDAILRSPASRDSKLASLKKLMQSGWAWSDYQSLLATAVDRRLQIVAANISRDALRSVAKTGFSALGAGESMRLGLEGDWSPAQQAELANDIALSHCGTLPDAAVVAISKSQRARDAIMTDRLLAVRSGTAVAIFGRGHVRYDLAVPVTLKQRAPNKTILSIDLAEVTAPMAPEEYAVGTLGQLFDYVIFTAAVKRETDPCAAFALPIPKEQFCCQTNRSLRKSSGKPK